MPRLVALQVERGPRFLDLLERIWGEGDAVLPIDPALGEHALHRILLRMRPHILIGPTGQHEIESPAEVADGTAAVMLTSGTTGEPKGVTLSHAAMDAAAAASAQRTGEGSEDRWLCALPLHHIAGLMILVRAKTGRPPAIHQHFDVDAIAAEDDVTMISVVPTMLDRLLDAEVDLSRFRVILLGGASVPSHLLERAPGRRTSCGPTG